ncbi:MAG: adenylyl-sulfate kinase [Tepidisphaeraceae bacterium]
MALPLTNRETNITWHEGAVTREDRQKCLDQKGAILWMTGLSGSGKSTIGSIVEQLLLEQGKIVYRLDGDNIRFGLNKDAKSLQQTAAYSESAAQRFGVGFSADDRMENIRRIGEVAKLFADAGVIAIASFISPYQRDRDAVRKGCRPGDFVEIYIKASLQAAEKRDPKGLYQKARAGQIKGFTGIDDPYEVPVNPELVIDTESLSPEAAARQIVQYLEQNQYLRA